MSKPLRKLDIMKEHVLLGKVVAGFNPLTFT